MRNVIRHSLLFFVLVSVFSTLNTGLAQAQTCEESACVRFTTRTGLINSTEVLLTNLLNSLFLGEEVLLTQVQIEALLEEEIEMNVLALELMSYVGVATVQELTLQTITFEGFIEAVGNTVDDPTVLAALQILASTSNASTSSFVIGDFLEISLLNLGQNNGLIRLSDLIDGAISHIYYSDYQGSAPIAVTINGSELGLGVANEIDVYLRITEPATISCGGEGTRFHSASTRIKLIVDLVDLDKTSTLNALLTTLGIDLGLVSNLDLSIGQIELYLDVGQAEGEIISINKENNEVVVEATPSVIDLYLGDIDDALFFSNGAIDPETDLDFANIGTLGFSVPNPLSTPLAPLPDIGISTIVQVKSYIDGASTANTETLTFTGPYPEIQTAGDSDNYIANLLSGLLSINFELRFELGGDVLSGATETLVNTTLDTLLPPVSTVVADVLADEILGPILDVLVDPILRRITGPIGEADVIVDGLNEYCEYSLSGTVYEDSNHNSIFESHESGTGEVIYAKLIDESSPAQAIQAVQVNLATGAYEFPLVASGTYTVLIDDNSTLTDITPAKPSGWIGTQNADLDWTGIQIVANSISNINFGLFHGNKIDGTSFLDDGSGGGTAYNGIRDGVEKVLLGSKIQLTNSDGSQIIDEAVTDGSGNFILWIPDAHDNSDLIIKELKAGGYLDVTGNVGNTLGNYSLENDEITFNYISGTSYSGVNFGNAAISTFNPDGQQQAAPGTSLFYRHKFTAGSAGTVEFTLGSSTSSGEESLWSKVLYEDSNCNGVLEPGEPIIEQKQLQAGEQVCLIAKVFVPNQAAYNETHTLIVNAEFSLTGTTLSGNFTVKDVTAVGDEGTSGLRIEKSVDKEEAFPGETITYTLTYTNYGSEPVTQVSIDDATPAYTVFVAASCDQVPQEITACTITKPAVGESGTIKWELTGEFAPGRTMLLSFQVLIE